MNTQTLPDGSMPEQGVKIVMEKEYQEQLNQKQLFKQIREDLKQQQLKMQTQIQMQWQQQQQIQFMQQQQQSMTYQQPMHQTGYPMQQQPMYHNPNVHPSFQQP